MRLTFPDYPVSQAKCASIAALDLHFSTARAEAIQTSEVGGSVCWTSILAVFLCAVCLLFSGAAVAGNVRLTHLAHLMADEAAGENAPELHVDFGGKIDFNGNPIIFEQTRLEDVQSRSGGVLHSYPAASGTATWLCYTVASKPRRTIWFVAFSPNSGPDLHAIGLVALQQIDTGATDGCSSVEAAKGRLTLGVPGMSATAAALKRHFGQLPYDRLRNVYYDSVRAAGHGKSIYQRLAYVVAHSGLVAGVALLQTTN